MELNSEISPQEKEGPSPEELAKLELAELNVRIELAEKAAVEANDDTERMKAERDVTRLKNLRKELDWVDGKKTEKEGG